MLFFSSLTSNFFDSFRLDNKLRGFWYRFLYTTLFVKMGAHIGHTQQNTLRQASWMIYGFKWDLVIINLVLTLFSIKGAIQFVLGCVKRCKPFWFVTQDKSFNRYVRYAALKCGEFSSTLFWIRGMASNYGTISEGFFKRKPRFVFMRKDFLFDYNYADWFFTRLARPGGLLLSSVFFSKFVVKDALCGYVGCFGLLDTNADSRDCSFALPSNDDSLDWVVFVNDIFSELILVKKFWVVLKWFYFLLKKPNFFPFFEKW